MTVKLAKRAPILRVSIHNLSFKPNFAVEPRNSVSQNSYFPRNSDFCLLTDFLSNIINIPQNIDFPRNSDFLPADGRSHYFEVLLYIQIFSTQNHLAKFTNLSKNRKSREFCQMVLESRYLNIHIKLVSSARL